MTEIVRVADLKAMDLAAINARQSAIVLGHMEVARKKLRELAVVQKGHFAHPRWSVPLKCSSCWVNIHALWEDPYNSRETLQTMAENLPREIKERVQFFAGPVTGGYAMARELAGYISSSRDRKLSEVKAVPMRPTIDGYEVHPYYKARIERLSGMFVDDVRFEGHTFNECAHQIVKAGAGLMGAAFVVDCVQQDDEYERGLPIYAIQKVDPGPIYLRADCPQCKKHLPYTEL